MTRIPTITYIDSDMRGESYSVILPGNRELILIHTKAGFYRGGHSHDRPETSLLLTGKAHYWKKVPNEKGGFLRFEFDELPGGTLHNEPGEVHRARFDEDSWLIDWKIGTKVGEAKTTNDPEYRAIVDKQMADAADFMSA